MIFIDDSEQEPDKIIFIQKNGDNVSKKTCKVTLKSGITFLDIQQKAQRNLHLGYVENFRLFNREGVEIFENDIQFLKNNYNLLASKGEDYDSSTGFSEYEMQKIIGEGGFGKVVLAEHKITKEQVAIKFVNTSLIGNASDIDMVFREAEVLKNLTHRNIVKIYNCYTLKGMEVVFIMEYLQGGELLDYVTKKGKLTELEARLFFRQIVDAIHYCHKENVIHRDLKLENILLLQSTSAIIKIIDFGIAGVGNLNTSKLNVGSLRYMAPEVLLKQVQSLQKSIDIWSLGVILYTLVCGNLPFNGDTPSEVIKKITSGNYSFPLQMEGFLTDEIQDLISNILVVDPNKRYTIKQIRLHEWMRLPTAYLTEQQEMVNQKQEKMNAMRNKEKNKIKYGYMVGREQTRLNAGGFTLKQNHNSPTSLSNRTKETTALFGKSIQQNPTQNSSPLNRESTRLNMLQESTAMQARQNNFSKFQNQGMREQTRMNGSPNNRSPTSTPLKTVFALKKQQQSQQLQQQQSQPMNKALQEPLYDLSEYEDYYTQENAVEEFVNEIKRILGKDVPKPRTFHKIGSNTDIQNTSALPPIQQTSNTQINTEIDDNIPPAHIRIVKHKGSKEIDESQVKTSAKDQQQQSISPNALKSNETKLALDMKRSSFEKSVQKIEILTESQPIEKSSQNKDANTSIINQSQENDNTANQENTKEKDEVNEEEEENKENNEQIKGKKKQTQYHRLVYMMRQRKQEEKGGDPNLQINKDYGGIYIPKEIGFIKYTANTNLRSLVTSPFRYKHHHYSPKKRSLSPKIRKEEQKTYGIFSPQNIFLKRPQTVKFQQSSLLNSSYH